MSTRRVLLVVLTVLVVFLTAKDMVRAQTANTCIDDLVLDTVTTGDDGVKRAILVYRGVTYKCAAGALVPAVGPVLKVNLIDDAGVTVLLLPSLKACTIPFTM